MSSARPWTLLVLPLLAATACQPHLGPARRPEPSTTEPQTAEQPGDTRPTKSAPVEAFPSAREALAALLEREPEAEVIAFGEIHQTRGEAESVASSLSRFTTELLPLLGEKASDLVIETWVASQGCGERGKEVASDVQQTTQRPSTTEQEVVAMIKAAQGHAIRPHILEMSCDDYESILVDGEIDYDQMLRVLTRLLQEKAIRLRDIRARRAGRAPSTVLLYGGNIHNELYPGEEVAPYSYGPTLDQMLVGRYLEVDLFVPELIEGDRHLPSEPWWPAFLEHQSADQVLLFERGPRSYVLVFQRGVPHRELPADESSPAM